MKITAIYMTNMFNMRFEEALKYPDTHTLPLTQLARSEVLPINILLSLNK